jgi:hypothetical protein
MVQLDANAALAVAGRDVTGHQDCASGGCERA